MYQIGTDREKWLNPQRNAQLGDIVLIKDKNLHGLEWSTGTIIEVYPDKDTLVRRVFVHSKCPCPKSHKHVRKSSILDIPAEIGPTNLQALSLAKQYALDSDHLATSIKGRKEDELPGYSQDERSFLEMVISCVKQRPDGMI